MLPTLCLLHFLVDACSAAVFVLSGDAWYLAYVYGGVAFALQAPLGIFLDVYPKPLRSCLLTVGCLLSAGGVLVGRGWGPLAVVVACLGNALFHVAAGKHLLERYDGSAAPQGLFISTGAFGLLLGLQAPPAMSSLWLMAPLMAYAAGLGCVWHLIGVVASKKDEACDLRRAPSGEARGWTTVLILTVMALVTLRSWSMLRVGLQTSIETVGLAQALVFALAVWGGKVMGGCCGDRWGQKIVIAVGLVGGVGIWPWAAVGNVWALVLVLFVVHLTTAPALCLLYGACRGRGGLASGLNCLSLFVGSLWV